MNLEEAKIIIADNYLGKEDSLLYLLYEDSYFSTEKYWAFYDSIACLASGHLKSEELSMQIASSYQRILKEILYHFDPNDISVLNNFPDNYNDYIERLDFAVLAYFESNPDLLDDEKFELQR